MATTTALKNASTLARARAGLSVELVCPDCFDAGAHDVNGDTSEPMACCRACGSHFDVLPRVQCRDCESLAQDDSRYCRGCGEQRKGYAADRAEATRG